MSDVLASDRGTTIIGMFDINTGEYVAYRRLDRMVESAERIVWAPPNIRRPLDIGASSIKDPGPRATYEQFCGAGTFSALTD
ncbi:hypothetical protein [Paraburkholderia tropica]|uniref:hypothetical protein n=1 Tax=Paraburkholderia tropica TaxID=92647 RepID=UPI003D2BA101